MRYALRFCRITPSASVKTATTTKNFPSAYRLTCTFPNDRFYARDISLGRRLPFGRYRSFHFPSSRPADNSCLLSAEGLKGFPSQVTRECPVCTQQKPVICRITLVTFLRNKAAARNVCKRRICTKNDEGPSTPSWWTSIGDGQLVVGRAAQTD